jgi:autotransporter-associated beta strand protein
VINNGVVQLNSTGALNSTAGSENAVSFGASTTTGKLALNGRSYVISNLISNAAPGSPVVENGNAAAVTLTVGNSQNLSGIYAGVIQNGTGGGALSLTKSGSGTLTLSGTNTYAGTTLISGGTLTLDATGTINNTSEVSLGTVGTFDVTAKGLSGYTVGTLKGSGNVTGALTVSTQLAIGNSLGTSNFSSDLTLGGGSTFVHELTSSAIPGLNSADLGDIAGALTITAGSILDLVQLGSYTAGNKFTLFAYDGLLTGTFKDTSSNVLSDGATFTDAGGIWTIDYNDTTPGANGGASASNTFVTITAVPEPNVAALLGGLGVFALLRRRR